MKTIDRWYSWGATSPLWGTGLALIGVGVALVAAAYREVHRHGR